MTITATVSSTKAPAFLLLYSLLAIHCLSVPLVPCLLGPRLSDPSSLFPAFDPPPHAVL